MSKEVIKLALEAMKMNPLDTPTVVYDEKYNNAIKAQEEALAKQEQGEPVAWMTPDGEGFRIRFSPPVNDVPLGWDALYTTPQQRTWVGLTEEEINQAYADSYKGIPLHEGIEAKLKEKNT